VQDLIVQQVQGEPTGDEKEGQAAEPPGVVPPERITMDR
jgi:hypothetical protein